MLLAGPGRTARQGQQQTNILFKDKKIFLLLIIFSTLRTYKFKKRGLRAKL